MAASGSTNVTLYEDILNRPLPQLVVLFQQFLDSCSGPVSQNGSLYKKYVSGDVLADRFKNCKDALAQLNTKYLPYEQKREPFKVSERILDELIPAEEQFDKARKKADELPLAQEREKDALLQKESEALEDIEAKDEQEERLTLQRMQKLNGRNQELTSLKATAEKAQAEVVDKIEHGCCSCFRCCIPKSLLDRRVQIQKEILGYERELEQIALTLQRSNSTPTAEDAILKENLAKAREAVHEVLENQGDEIKQAEEDEQVALANLAAVENTYEREKIEFNRAFSFEITSHCLHVYACFLSFREHIEELMRDHKNLANLNLVQLQKFCIDHKNIIEEEYLKHFFCPEVKDKKAIHIYNEITVNAGLKAKLLKQPLTKEECQPALVFIQGKRLELLRKHKINLVPGLFAKSPVSSPAQSITSPRPS